MTRANFKLPTPYLGRQGIWLKGLAKRCLNVSKSGRLWRIHDIAITRVMNAANKSDVENDISGGAE